MSEFEKWEAEYIKLYKSDYLTNSDDTGQGNGNRIKEVIERAKESMGRRVYQYSLDGEFIKEHKSARDAASEIGSNHGNISRCCNGIIKHANGFIFKYEKVEKVDKITNPNAAKKKVIELDDKGNILNTWNSLMDCARETGLDNGNLSRACNGVIKKHKGRTFKFAEQNTIFAE